MIVKYPGGKFRVLNQLVERLNSIRGTAREYREPFVGGGSVFFHFLRQAPDIEAVWLNDKFPPVASFWTAVFRYPDHLIHRLHQFGYEVGQWVDPAEYRGYVTQLLALDHVPDGDGVVETAALFVAAQLMSRNGVLSTHPTLRLDRWNPGFYAKRVRQTVAMFQNKDVRITCTDFAGLLGGAAVVYLDPPYWKQGDVLYPVSFSADDHLRLRNTLAKSGTNWLLSYDDHPVIRGLYRSMAVETMAVPYTRDGYVVPTDELVISR